MQEPTIDAKWCHLIWSTYRQRKRFNLAERGAFCERVIRDVGRTLGWPVEAVRVTECTAHALFRVPLAAERGTVGRTVLRATRRALKRKRLVARWAFPLWAPSYWCVFMTNATSVAAVRDHIHTRSRSYERDFNRRVDAWRVDGASVREEMPSGADQVFRLG